MRGEWCKEPDVIAQPKYVYSIREDLFFNSFKVATQYNSFEFYA